MLFFQDANHKGTRRSLFLRRVLDQAVDQSEIEFAFGWLDEFPVNRHEYGVEIQPGEFGPERAHVLNA